MEHEITVDGFMMARFPKKRHLSLAGVKFTQRLVFNFSLRPYFSFSYNLDSRALQSPDVIESPTSK